MSITTTFVCECNGINYCNKSSLNNIKKLKNIYIMKLIKKLKI